MKRMTKERLTDTQEQVINDMIARFEPLLKGTLSGNELMTPQLQEAISRLSPAEREELREMLSTWKNAVQILIERLDPLVTAIATLFGVGCEILREIPAMAGAFDFPNWDIDGIKNAFHIHVVNRMSQAAGDRTEDLRSLFDFAATIMASQLKIVLVSPTAIPKCVSPAVNTIIMNVCRRIAASSAGIILNEFVADLTALSSKWEGDQKPETYWVTLKHLVAAVQGCHYRSAPIGPQRPGIQVALSFAGEDRDYVERVAEVLRANQIRVFYDAYEEVDLWGKNLGEHLYKVYRSAQFCVMFVSRHYVEKIWPTHERRSAFERALESREEYILPARFDDTEVPGLYKTVAYVDLRRKTPEQLAMLILQKLRHSD